MRVCVLIGRYAPEFGGHSLQMQRILPYFDAHGVELTILTQTLPESMQEPELPESNRIFRIFSREDGIRARIATALAFRRHFRERPGHYDVVHAELSRWDFYLNLGFLKKLGLPVLCEMVNLGGDDPLTLSRSRLGRVKLALLRKVDLWTGISSPFLAAVTAVGLPAERFHVVPTGVDVERYRPRNDAERADLRERLNLPRDARIVFTVGAVIPRKGMDRSIETWATIRPRPGRDLFLIIGPLHANDPPSAENLEHLAKIQARIEKPDVAGTVRLVGQVDNLEDFMGAADLFLFLSRREGIGNVIIEAMGSGLACIVSPLDGIAYDMIESGTNGIIASDPDDAATVGRLLAETLSSPKRWSMGEAARAVVVERFSLDARAIRLKKLYQQLVAEQRVAG